MRYAWIGVSCLLTSLTLTTTAFAQGEEPLEPIVPEGGDSVILNGQPANPFDWGGTAIASLRVTKDGEKIVGRCTATIVGQQVALTAAHCVDDNEGGSIKLGGVKYQVTCRRHPQYDTDYTKDYALCVTDKVISGRTYEVINTSIAYPQVNHPVTLLGFGCTEGGHNRNYPMLYRSTEAHVVARPVETANSMANFFKIKGKSAVCYGDSGGAAYIYIGGVGRRIFGVNARGNIEDTSYIAPTNTNSFIDFVLAWSGGTHRVCGIHPEAAGCRTN